MVHEYIYDSTPFIVLNSDRVIESIPFKKDDEFFLFHSCKAASEDVLMKLLTLEHRYLEDTLEYCYDENQVIDLPKSISMILPMRISPKYELLDFNSDLQSLLKWFHELLQAVEYLHSQGIIHSNIHPNACHISNNSLVLGELQDIILPDAKYDARALRERSWAPEVKHEDLYPVISKKMDIFMLGIVLSAWLESYLCTVPLLPRNYLPSKLDSYLESIDDFMQIDCLSNADLFPPIFKLIAAMILVLMNPNSEDRFTIEQALQHNLIAIVKRPIFVQSSFFAGTKRNEWIEKNIKRQFDGRQRSPTKSTGLWFV